MANCIVLLLLAASMGSIWSFSFPLKRDSAMTNYEFATYMIRHGDLDNNGKMSRSEISKYFTVFVKLDQSSAQFIGQKFLEYGDVFNADGELDFMELLLALERIYE